MSVNITVGPEIRPQFNGTYLSCVIYQSNAFNKISDNSSILTVYRKSTTIKKGENLGNHILEIASRHHMLSANQLYRSIRKNIYTHPQNFICVYVKLSKNFVLHAVTN